ncbi:MAG: hypothetical protein ABJF11_16785 [Reichenbachiella sp.]|uniref:hypothetical protein n=1 Tax=Reichenbachiella sp. TaxID=2184521 RepID=UPI003266E54A
MRTTVLLLVIVANTLIMVGCEEKQDEISPFTWSWTDTEQSFAEIDISPGTTTDVILEIPDPPYEYAFRVIAPKSIDEENGNPLVFSIHGGVGGAGREAHKSTDCIAPALEEINAFVISPNADKVQWYEVYNQIKMANLITMAVNNWPIDTTKIVATGYSDGGNGTWFLAERYPNVFSAGIALATSYNTLTTSGDARKIDIPLYVIHSTGDELFPLDQTQYWVDQTIAAGSDINFVIADGLSHYAPCDYTDHFEDAVQWLEDEVWE